VKIPSTEQLTNSAFAVPRS